MYPNSLPLPSREHGSIYLPILAFPVFTLARTRPLRTTAVAQTTRKPLVSNHALRLSAKFGCLVGLNITREWSDVSRAARTHQSGTPFPTAWPDPTACVGMPLTWLYLPTDSPAIMPSSTPVFYTIVSCNNDRPEMMRICDEMVMYLCQRYQTCVM